VANESGIRRFSATELRERRLQGASQTDLARLRAITDDDVERSVAADPDWQGVSEDWFRDAEAVIPSGKKLISLRLDTDVVEWFKATGPGYQTRINHVLRTFMEHSNKARGAA
jgi:uncharacterized protein (DUF4415 family)